MNDSTESSPLLTKKEAAHYLNVSERNLDRLRKTGGLTAIKLNGWLVRFRKQDLDTYLETHREQGKQPLLAKEEPSHAQR